MVFESSPFSFRPCVSLYWFWLSQPGSQPRWWLEATTEGRLVVQGEIQYG